jgi:hypothetical protein
MHMISLSSHHDLLGDYNSIQHIYIMIFQIFILGQFNDDDVAAFVTFHITPVLG